MLPNAQVRCRFALLADMILLLLIICSLGPVRAQITSGKINLVVVDSSGASIKGASVKITNRDTGVVRTGTTNDSGESLVPFLPVGQYAIAVEYPGFKTSAIAEVTIQVDQTLGIRVTLESGEVHETVRVKSVAESLETETSSLGQVIQNKQILELPLNGRNPFALGLLSGNTTLAFGMGTNLPFIAGGGRFSSNEVTLDGVDDNEVSNATSIGRNGIALTPSVDAVEEFKVKTSTFSAEFGHAAGAVVNATIKSGSNQFHGTVFEFLRNDDLDANNVFENAAGQQRVPFHQNQFGAAVGGPIVHDKTFFFADYQGTRQASVTGSALSEVPTAALRSGDFSQTGITIYDPASRVIGPTGLVISTPLPGNIIPQSSMNSSVVATEGLIPQPNFGPPGALALNYLYLPATASNTDQGDFRIDETISAKDNLFARYSIADNYQPAVGSFPGFIGGGSGAINNAEQAVISEIHIFTPALVNEFRFGYARHNGSAPGNTGAGRQFAATNSIASVPSPEPGFPGISFIYAGTVSGSTEFTGWGGGNPDLQIENRFQWSDNLSWTHGRHALKTGVDFRREQFDTLVGNVGAYVFASTFTSSSNAPGSGLPYADFLFGYPTSVSGTPMLAWGNQRSIVASGFVQDDWKIANSLTLNLGLRYDLFTQPVDAHNVGSLFNIATGQFALPGQNGYSRAIVEGDHNNFGPASEWHGR